MSAKSKSLVIVESPAKAKTIAGYLGADFVVESSIGHIRDLPKSAEDIPAEFKGTPAGRLGVDVEHNFKPIYVVDSAKRDHIKRLQQLVKEADQLYLATDEDREGESIAWHLLEVLKPNIPVKRMAFHEITKKAILSAIEQPRDIDRRLVDAQEARRILDRLYGYEVSPVLWKKVMPKLSAGRVQSVATRIVVERETARRRFVAAQYWDIGGHFRTQGGGEFDAALLSVNGVRVATGKDFDDEGKLEKDDLVRLDRAATEKLVAGLKSAAFRAQSVEKKANRRSPAPPFMTSTLQQEASRKLRFSSQRCMRAAQTLYEGGFITYMRTDSTTLSETAINAARKLIETQYGAEYLPAAPRVYRSKVKNAQEAHEAIRPAGDAFQAPSAVAALIGSDEARLYEMIWKRTVASQMEDSRGQSVKLVLNAKVGNEAVEFTASGYTITFPGFLRAYVEGSDDPQAELEEKETPLPVVEEGENLSGDDFEARPHETQPPARFTEASLVKRLEELGVGRPSTYASIISTIQARGYVWKKGSALVPSFKAFAVIQLLEQHFGALVDYSFTARMEDELDSIANGDEQSVPWLKRFYFGAGTKRNADNGLEALGLRSLVAERLGEIDARAVNSLSIGKDEAGVEIVLRVGRFGPYLQRGDDTANVPEDLAPDELTPTKALELLAAPSGDRLLGTEPVTSLPIYARAGRFGSYVQLGEAGGKEKPRTASMLKSMTALTITLEESLQMLSLPRQVGNDPESGALITAQLGRYGPYISRGTDSRSLEKEEEVFTVNLDQALELLRQPKTRGRKKQNESLKELGNDSNSGGAVTVREGRFGLYVTDGETNASLRKGDSLENVTIERAQELLEERRERGPSAKKTRKKASKKSASAEGADTEEASAKPARPKKKAAKAAPKKAAKKTKAVEASTDDAVEAASKKSSRAPKAASNGSKASAKAKKSGTSEAPKSKRPSRRPAAAELS